jgi:hypothetical protein
MLWTLVSVVLLAATSANAQLLVVSQGDVRNLEYDPAFVIPSLGVRLPPR